MINTWMPSLMATLLSQRCTLSVTSPLLATIAGVDGQRRGLLRFLLRERLIDNQLLGLRSTSSTASTGVDGVVTSGVGGVHTPTNIGSDSLRRDFKLLRSRVNVFSIVMIKLRQSTRIQFINPLEIIL